MSVFSKRLKKVRTAQGKTCIDVACGAGLNDNCVFFWEREERSPNMKSLVKLADYLGVSMDYLAGRTDNPNINR